MGTPHGYWLMKSEPDVYSFADLERDGETRWDGVRNFEARNNLRAMKRGDLALYYHSNIGKEVAGVMRVVGEAVPDQTAPGEDWSVVTVAPVIALAAPVTLELLREKLPELEMFRRNRLSVVPVSKAHFAAVLKLGKTKLPA